MEKRISQSSCYKIKFIFWYYNFQYTNYNVQYIYVCAMSAASNRTYTVESLPQKLTRSKLLLIKNYSNWALKYSLDAENKNKIVCITKQKKFYP